MRVLHPDKPKARRLTGTMAAALRHVAWTAAFALTWLLLLRFGSVPAAAELDLSWGAVLGWAYVNEARFGADLVFTFGPLGYLYPTAAYFPGVWPAFWVGQILLSGVTAGLLTGMASCLSPWVRAGWFGLFLAGFIWLAGDAAWFLSGAFLIALSPRQIGQAGPPTLREVSFVLLSAGYLSILSFIKFSVFPVLVIFLGLTSVLVLLRKGLAWSLATALAVAAVPLAVWLASGQSVDDLGGHLLWSFRFSAGYAEAMAMAPELRYDVLLSAFAVGIVGVAALVGLRKPVNLPRLLATLAVMAVFAIAWRASVTRLPAEKIVFVVPLIGGFLAVLAATAGGGRWTSGLAAAGLLSAAMITLALAPMGPLGVVLEVAPQLVVRNLGTILHPRASEAGRMALWNQKMAEHRMEAVAATVNGGTVDLVSHSQGLLLLNELNYAPRPVFQGYAAYGQALARLNEQHFLSDRAPDYVLFSVQPIDGRLPGSEDPLTLTSILRGYLPVLMEQGQLLLSRAAQASEVRPVQAPPDAEWVDVPMGQFVDIPSGTRDQIVVLFARVPRLDGSGLNSTLLRPHPFQIEVETGSGRASTFRVVPELLHAGVVVEPLMESTTDAAKWMAGFGDLNPHSRVRRLRFLSGNRPDNGDAPVAVAFTLLDRSAPPASSLDQSIVTALIPGFSHAPDRRFGVVNSSIEADASTLLMHPPAAIEFDLGPGVWTIRGFAGMHAVTATLPECASADGVRLGISVRLEGASSFTELASVDLPAPDSQSPKYPVEQFDHSIEIAGAAHLRFTTDGGAANDLTCDWAYLRDLQLVPANGS